MERRRLLAAAVVVVFVALLLAVTIMSVSPPAAHPFFQVPGNHVRVIAHRGGALLRPENTLLAFRNAVELGVDALEMDLRLAADGRIVVIHDDTVDRTTDGAGIVGELTLDELRRFDAGCRFTLDGGETFPFREQGLQIPVLEQVFEQFAGIQMILEVKQNEPPMEALLCDLIRRFYMGERVIIASFHDAVLSRFRQMCPEVATSAGRAEARRFVKLYRAATSRLHRPSALVLQVPEHADGKRILTADFVKASKLHYHEVHAWTVNDLEARNRLVSIGVDGIITDRPDLMLDNNRVAC